MRRKADREGESVAGELGKEGMRKGEIERGKKGSDNERERE